MSTKKLVLFTSISLMALMAGCGRQYSGVYRGRESVAMPNTQATENQLTITLNQNNGDQVSGTWQNSRGESGTLTGRDGNDGLTNVTLTMSGNGFGGSGYWMPTAGCQQTYTGTLSAPNVNQLTGTLISNGGACGGFPGQQQGGSRTIDVSR